MDNEKYINEKDISDMIEIRNEPHIYAFSTETIPNYIKVGDTFRPIEKRLTEWRKHFENLKRLFPNKNEESQSIAKVDDDVYFRDYEVHKYLNNNNFENLGKQDFDLLFNKIGNLYYSNEFFKNATPNDVMLAINDIKGNYTNKGNNYNYFKLSNSNRISYVEHWTNSENWELRPNQKKVVENFIQKVNDGETELLMYAVMRFGKSFTALSCASAKEYKKVLVVSAKADVVNEWKKTVEKPKCFKDYAFLCDNDFKENNNLINDIINKRISDNEYFRDKSRVVVFMTLQNLSGKDSTGKNIKERLEKVFETEFDLIVVDETHFGAWANNYGTPLSKDEDKESVSSDIKENQKFIEVIEKKKLKSKVKLHLSGTPYNLLYDQKFTEKNIIATCQFSDILTDKEKWDEEHLGKIIPDTNNKCEYEEYDNPYFGFPKMLRFAFNIPQSIQSFIEKEKGKYSLNNLFLTDEKKDTKFVHEKDVLTLLKAIDSKDNQTDGILSFLDIPKIKDNKVCKHIVMVLPFKYSCDAMELLLKNNKNQFKNLYNDNVEIINITGHNLQQKYNDIDKVKNAITSFEKHGKKTISLTVNKMLTGVTVPEWDTMIMLKDTRSAQEYDQAIFRIQNQYVKEIEEDTNKKEKRTAKIDLKPQTILVDFDPVRMFELQGLSTRIVHDINKDSKAQLDDSIKRELEFFPIISFNADKIVKVTPNNIVELISEYNRNKSLVDQSKTVDLDRNLLSNEQFKDFINSLSEKGIKSNLSGLIHSGEDTSEFDTGMLNNDNNETSDIKSKDEKTNITNTQLPKNDNVIDVKKYQTFVSSLLFFSFLTKSKIFTIKDIIDRIENKNNSNENYAEDIRIFNNLNLNLDMIKYHYEECNKVFAVELNNKIASANLLSQDNTLTPEQRVKVALNNFSYISESEIVTPPKVANEMCNLIGTDTLKNIVNHDGKILDIASKTGEFSVSLYNLLSSEMDIPKNKIINAIYCIPTSSLTYELTLKVYDILGLNKSNIANVTTYSLLTHHKLKFNKKQNKNIETDEIDYDKIIEILSDGKTFNKGGQKMKFDAVVGNPPYQEESKVKNLINGQNPRTNIFQYFEILSNKLCKNRTCLIFPGIRWLHQSGKGLKQFGYDLINNKNVDTIVFYPNAQEIFDSSGIPDGITIVLTDKNKNCSGFKYVYSQANNRKILYCNNPGKELMIINPDDYQIANKINDFVKQNNLKFLHDSILSRALFDIDSDFVQKNNGQIKILNKDDKIDYTHKVKLFTNDKAGSAGRTKWYVVDKTIIKKNKEYINQWQVVVSSAHAGGQEGRDNQLAIIDNHSTFGRARIALKSFNAEDEAKNFFKYVQSNVVKYAFLLSDEALSSLAKYVPDLNDYSNDNKFIDFSKDVNSQLYKLIGLNNSEIDFIEKTVKPME